MRVELRTCKVVWVGFLVCACRSEGVLLCARVYLEGEEAPVVAPLPSLPQANAAHFSIHSTIPLDCSNINILA